MAHQRLNREGYNSSRNFSKPYRLPRVVKDKQGNEKFHDLDMMRLGRNGQVVNSTGCFGIVSTWGVGRISIVIRRGAPGKVRAPRKRKNTCRLYSGTVWIDFEKGSFQELVNLRACMLTVKLMGDHIGRQLLSPGLMLILEQITTYLTDTYRTDQDKLLEIVRSDTDRQRSVKGMMESGHVQIEQIKSLGQRVKRALALMTVERNDT